MEEHNHETPFGDLLNHQILAALSKPANLRTFDDLLLLKSYMLETEFFEKSQLDNANPRQINDLCRGIELEVRKVGEVIFSQGDIGDKVYIILFGKVEFIARFTIDLTQGQTEIREKKLDTFSSGKIFGERALQFDEPRSATAQCVEDTYLITVDKSAYLRVLDDVRQQKIFNFRPDQLKADQVSRETVMAILRKKRDRRTHQELEAAALYLCNRTKVESFQKLSMAQVVEVCRVAETLTIWGKSLVCKQGEVGPVFYAVLSGSVEVWVSKDTPQSVRTGSRHLDITEGLGRMENQLVTGKTFGDRALSAMDSLRKASIVTCEDATELLVIFRKDYENLIAATSQVETMAKVRLLRKTDIFHNLDMIHLRALSNIMEPKTFAIDETVVMAGKRATEAIVIERGELTVLTEVLEGYAKDGYEELMAQQKYHHYLEDKHHRAHLTSDGRPMPDAAEHNHDKLKKMPVKKNDILDTAKQDSQKHMQTKLQKIPSSFGNAYTSASSGSSGGMMKDVSGKDLNTQSLSSQGSQPFEASVRDSNSPPNGRRSSRTDRRRNPRFQSTQLVPIGRRRKVTLGRIAPNSVLSTYTMTSATQHDEVYHPETIIATTLVNAYTINKHAFFTSLPKDSKYAIVKIIKEYKAPVLTSLWENAPRVLDETQWKMDKTWKNFKARFMEHGHKANILDSHKRMENLHISVNSGNDPGVKLMPRHYQFLNQNKDHGAAAALAILDPSKRRQEVSLEWGLPSKKDPTASPIAAAAAAAVLQFSASINASELQAGIVDPSKGRPTFHTVEEHSQGYHQFGHHQEDVPTPGVILAPTLSTSISSPLLHGHDNFHSLPAKPEPLVSFRIRERLNLSRSMNALSEKQLSALTASHSETALLRNSTHGSDGLNNSPSKSSMQKIQKKFNAIELPFALIQIHREVSGRNAINLASTSRRPVRSYVRICGSFPSCAKAKDMADLQMEQYYLQLYHSEATKEEELLLNWQTFNGYDTMALDATDHFLIFCRSTPVEFATLRPSKNIFNVRFPAMCKPQNQRYAVLLVNPIPPTSTELCKRAQQQQQQQQQEDNPEDSTDSDDEKDMSNSQMRRHSKRKMQFKNMGTSAMGISGAGGGANGGGALMMGASFSTNTGSGNAVVVNFQSDTTELGNTGVGMNKDGKPIHLTELSVVQETIAITSTRLDGLRYAINHFGRVIPALTPVTVNGVGHRLPANDISASVVSLSGTSASDNDAALNAAIMSTPYEHLDPQQQQLQDMLITTFMANQQMLRQEQQAGHEGESAFRTKHEHEQHLSHAAAAGKRRLGNCSMIFSPPQQQEHGVHPQVLSNDQNIHQLVALGAITVILKPLSNAFLGNTGNALDTSGTPSPGVAGSSPAVGERILRLLHNSALQNQFHPSQRQRVCVLPLFRWILIDSPTLDILDFTKAFHEDAIKNIFLAEQEEFVQQRQQLTLSPRSALNSRANSRQQHNRRPGSTSGKMEMMSYGNFHQQANALGNADGSEDDQDNDHHHPEVFEYHGGSTDHTTSSWRQQSSQSQQAWAREVNQYRDFTREVLDNQQLPSQLLSSMSEAGLLPKKTVKAVSVRFASEQHHGRSHAEPLYSSSSKKKGNGVGRVGMGSVGSGLSRTPAMSHANGIEQLHNTSGQDTHPHDLHRLQILQQEIVFQEISQQMQQVQLRQASTLTSEQLAESDPLINSLINETIAEDRNSVFHVAGGNRMSAIDKEIAVAGQQLSQTIAQMQTTIAMTGQALQVHDKLCDLEYSTHNRYANRSSAVAQQKSLEVLNRRMGVIEGFQKLSVTPSQPQPVTLFGLYQQTGADSNGTGGGANHTAPAVAAATARRPPNGLTSAKFTNNANSNNANGNSSGASGNTLSSNVNVAKRLNETLKVLSETIDGPYKRQMFDLQRTKEIEQQEKVNRMTKFTNSVAQLCGADVANAGAGTIANTGSGSANNNASSPSVLASPAASMLGNISSNNINTSSANSVVSATSSMPSLSHQISQSSLALSV